MRRRLSATILAIVGLGVPVLVALLTRRTDDDRTAPTKGPTTEPLSGPLAAAGALIASGPPCGESLRPILEPHPTGVLAPIGRFYYRYRPLPAVPGQGPVFGAHFRDGTCSGTRH